MTFQLSPLLAVAIGDAYALPFEYRRGLLASWAHLNDGAHYELHTKFFATCPLGSASDDTQLSVALAEMMVQPSFAEGSAEDLAFLDGAFIKAFQRNPHAGYSRGMTEGFKKAIVGGRTIGSVCAEHGKTTKSGAAMRATPLGLLDNLADVLTCAKTQGAITHMGTALVAAQAAAAATHYMYYGFGSRQDLGHWLDQTLAVHGYRWSKPWQGSVGSPGTESTHAAITAVMEATSLRDLLIRCVAFTGDVDTVAAIAMGAAWGYPDLPNDLAESLLTGLEPHSSLKGLMADLDNKLLAKYPRPAV
jgi:ADP-ribosyl-[dinitrogen reductase] hydrolase